MSNSVRWIPSCAGASLFLIGTAGAQVIETATIAANEASTGQDAPIAIEGLIPVSVADSDASPAGPAAATLAGEKRANVIEEIVVTAQKREQSINEVPIAISAYSGEDLQQRGISDTTDLANLTPGFKFSNSGFNTPIYTLRGVGFNEPSQTASSTVGVYVDEISLPYPVMTKGANIDIQRVEILKGPQGTLYGRNTTGGAVNYIANKPSSTFEAGINGSIARFQTTDIDGFVSGPLLDGLDGRLALRDVRSQQGWQHSLTRPDDHLGRQDKQSGRGSLSWMASDNVDVRFVLSGWRDYSEPQAPQAIGLRPQNQLVPETPFLPPDFPLIGGSIALSPEVRNHPLVPVNSNDPQVADWAPEVGWQLRDRFLMGDLRADWRWTEDSTLSFLGSVADYRSDGAWIPQQGLSVLNSDRRVEDHTKAVSGELRWSGELDSDLKYLAGLYASHDTVTEFQVAFIPTNSAVVPTPLGPVLDDRLDVYGDQTADTGAVFGNIDWQFAESLGLNLGLRYTREKREYSGCSADDPQGRGILGFAATFNAVSLSRGGTGGVQEGGCFTLDADTGNPGLVTPPALDESNLSGRSALTWTPQRGSLYYLSYSRGFKSGSFPVLAATDSSQYDPVTQEQLDAFEAGTKLTLLDGAMQFNTSGFYYAYQDKQLLSRILDPIFGPLPTLKNAPKSRVQGIEADVQILPADGLRLSAAAAFIDTEILEFTGINESGDEQNFAGKPFNYTPRLTYSLVADYRRPLSDQLEMNLGTDYSHTDSTNASLSEIPIYRLPSYNLLNLRAGVAGTDGRWRLMAWCRNVTNEFSAVSVVSTGDVVARFTGLPRTYGITYGRNFD